VASGPWTSLTSFLFRFALIPDWFTSKSDLRCIRFSFDTRQSRSRVLRRKCYLSRSGNVLLAAATTERDRNAGGLAVLVHSSALIGRRMIVGNMAGENQLVNVRSLLRSGSSAANAPEIRTLTRMPLGLRNWFWRNTKRRHKVDEPWQGVKVLYPARRIYCPLRASAKQSIPIQPILHFDQGGLTCVRRIR
jgi:hypothetical protein